MCVYLSGFLGLRPRLSSSFGLAPGAPVTGLRGITKAVLPPCTCSCFPKDLVCLVPVFLGLVFGVRTAADDQKLLEAEHEQQGHLPSQEELQSFAFCS